MGNHRLSRREFIRLSALVSLGFTGLQAFAGNLATPPRAKRMVKGYGPLTHDRDGILNLPRNFSYKIISRAGERMSDGLRVPGRPDGMATFRGQNGKTLILRNHELDVDMRDKSPFGMRHEYLTRSMKAQLYDAGPLNGEPCPGGCTTLVFDTATQRVEEEFLSLAGTLRNCAGGPTPWNTWISCEETVDGPCSIFTQWHGYPFEVPASEEQKLCDPIPLRDMGRFQHEAVCVDPRTGIVYQTEDRPDGLIYRYIPNEYGNLRGGGRLQALMILGEPSKDTRNWPELEIEVFPEGVPVSVTWMDLEEIHAPADDLRKRGFGRGAARFARGEGMWFGENELYFACTNGGSKQQGQIFRYVPSPHEGTARENESPGQLELFLESDRSRLVQHCDNLTIGPSGDLVVCEDRPHPRIMGITPSGGSYVIAENVGFESEFAGAVFSPDGTTMFVNIQDAGLTIAITGPWGKSTESTAQR
ncbi:MAG: DUF839 domain-containing protein [Bacteroidetes bacterium]|nr:MAG: DUF839 domain-containing protein [Bacteroidota bacterium]